MNTCPFSVLSSESHLWRVCVPLRVCRRGMALWSVERETGHTYRSVDEIINDAGMSRYCSGV
jgi:hypothetical protein